MNYTTTLKHVRMLLHTKKVFDSADVELLQYFMNSFHRLGNEYEIEAAWVDSTPGTQYGTQKNIFIRGYVNGKRVLRSMLSINNSCAKPEYSSEIIYRRQLKIAMRAAITDTIITFRNEQRSEACSCGTKWTETEIHVDHTGQHEYRHIEEAYLNLVLAETLPEIEVQSHGFTLKNPEEWVAFHNELATLQLLCKKCNLEKSK